MIQLIREVRLIDSQSETVGNQQSKLVDPQNVRVELRELHEQATRTNCFIIRGMGITSLDAGVNKNSDCCRFLSLRDIELLER